MAGKGERSKIISEIVGMKQKKVVRIQEDMKKHSAICSENSHAAKITLGIVGDQRF